MKYIILFPLLLFSLCLSAQESKHRSSISFSLGIAHYNFDHDDLNAGAVDFAGVLPMITHSNYINYSFKAHYKYRIASHLQIGAFITHLFEDGYFPPGLTTLEGGLTANTCINIQKWFYVSPGVLISYSNMGVSNSPKMLDILSAGATLCVGLNISPKTSISVEPVVNKLMRDGRGTNTALHAGFNFKL